MNPGFKSWTAVNPGFKSGFKSWTAVNPGFKSGFKSWCDDGCFPALFYLTSRLVL